MSSDKQWGTIQPQSGNVLTSAYGDQSAGWTTQAMDVSAFDFITLEFDYGNHSVATSLFMRALQADRNAADLDAFSAMLYDSGGGVLAEDELSYPVTANAIRSLPPMDVRGISLLRIAARVDNPAGGPTLSMRYVGHRNSVQPAQLQSPNQPTP